MSTEESLLRRVAAGLARDGGAVHPASQSILSQAASSYAKRPLAAEATIPTGFDPRAAVLFEAVVEAAYLVATSDGVFDDAERRAFEQVVTQACGNAVQPGAVHDLVTDLGARQTHEGSTRRVRAVAAAVVTEDHKTEVLRIAALMAHVSGGVAQAERAVLDELAGALGLGWDSVDRALGQAEQALRGG